VKHGAWIYFEFMLFQCTYS